MQVNIKSDANVKYINKNQDVTTQNETTEEEEEFEETKPQTGSENQSIAIDWDSEQTWETRLWARIMEEKEEKRKALQLIEQKTREQLT